MKKVGITGQHGFIGWHLCQTLKLFPNQYQLIDFERSFFDTPEYLDRFVTDCDVIVHLGGLNRHEDQNEIYKTNVDLSLKLVAALQRTAARPHVLMSSSTQEEKDNHYGNSKKEGRSLIAQWATENKATFTGLILPNVFGPFGKPYYNSFIATFCHQLCNNESPSIQVDAEVPLISVGDVVYEMRNVIDAGLNNAAYQVKPKTNIRVSSVLQQLITYKEQYFDNGIIPALPAKFDVELFNTFRSFMNHKQHYPRLFTLNTDERGSFVELIRLETGGQVSFSTTVPGVIRGNHFHTRKIERFAVIKGNALIQLRKIGSNETFDFHLDGNTPSYVDMPVWFTHNIKNTGSDTLYTIFWISEFYNSADPDTYFEQV